MSAFVMSPEDFSYIASVMHRIAGFAASKRDVVVAVNSLIDENAKSVAYRYSQTIAEAMADSNARYITGADIVDVDIFADEVDGALKCLKYQSSEHPEWKTSDARQAIERVEEISSLFPKSGNSGWGAPEHFVRKLDRAA